MTPLDVADPSQLRRRALEEGYLYLPRWVAPDALRDVIHRALERRGWLVGGRSDPALRLGAHDDPRWIDLLNEVLPSPACRALGRSPQILSALRELFGGEPELAAGDVLRLVSPGAVDLATPPHQDAAYLPADVWAAWIAIDPCPLELGPLALLPRSHQHGLLPQLPDDAPWRASPLEAGDVILFSALTAHRALPNRTRDRLRISIDYRYRPLRARAGGAAGG